VHWRAKQILQIALQGRLIDQTPSFAKLNEHIYVATWPLVASRDRSKDAQRSSAVMRGNTSDLIPPVAQLVETRRRTGRARVRIGRTATLDLSAAIG
jgi:hypothetical protein